MDARPQSAPDPAILEANLSALDVYQPLTTERLRAALPPPSVRQVFGRDGRATFNWCDESGRLHWLGRTSMPSISSVALLDAFQPGTRNVLFAGFGQGAEARLLLDRLAPCQSLSIIEESIWAARLTLQLHDFSENLRRGRLLVFVGSTAWNDLREFLLAHDGCLTPERMLSWPWFDPKTIADVTARLMEISREVAQHRADKHAAIRAAAVRERSSALAAGPLPHGRGSGRAGTLALLSNICQAPIRMLADRLQAAAEELGRPCVRFVLDDPMMVHPFAIEQALSQADPSMLIFLDATPGSLQCELPPAPGIVVCPHRQTLAKDWVGALDSEVRLAVPATTQLRQLAELGLVESRLLLIPPAAWPGLARDRIQPGEGVIVVADSPNASAGGAGLHLASHRQLWEAATAIIRERCDVYDDDQASAALEAAQKRLGIELDSEEVRGGIVERVRQFLGPAIVRRSYVTALASADIEFDLYGDGWAGDSSLAKHYRGPLPPPRELERALRGHGLIIAIEPSGIVEHVLLDAMAAGLGGAVRAHPLDETRDGLSGVLDTDRHVWRFHTRSDLVKLAREFRRKPDAFRAKAEAARQHINACHTWTHRLRAMLQVCGVS